jgi:type IV secretory pathway TrbD component
MFFGMMMGAQRVVIMVPMTAVACVREHNVLVLVVADPIPAAFGLRQVSRLSAKTAPIFLDRDLECLFFLGHGSS